MGIEQSIKQDKLRDAFRLVDPVEHMVWCFGVEQYLKYKDSVTWRDEIAACIPDSALKQAGVTIGDVAEAIDFYTSTKATITRCPIGKLGHRDFQGELGYLIRADGYRKGPAGP